MNTLAKAVLLWSAIIPFAILNGLFRDSCLAKIVHARTARTLSGVSLGLIVLGFAVATIGWLPPSGTAVYLGVGALWVVLTIAFEFLFGRYVAKRTWTELLRPYRFEDGDVWPLVLVTIAFSPALAVLLRKGG